ncbi:SubName: Full=Related to archipelago beta form (F-box-WD40 repeat protein) {ECO:0000313/EMBL:CCA68914.1} [Serendipita indica DSM 11827]|nr:SubName: Full=Related to archipelago beta form (F-box-WD40 repeat protein) {ECO:0000313/EMBL:CCA68914.1} [Serendipita indica DSM 11827]
MSTLKSKRAKKPRPTGKAPGSSSSAPKFDQTEARVYDTVNVGLDFVANLSDVRCTRPTLQSSLSGLKVDPGRQNKNKVQTDSGAILRGRIVEEAFSQPFIDTSKFLEDLSAKVLNYVEKRSQTTRGRATQVREKQFMEALNIFTTLRIQSIERSTKDTKVNVEKSLTDNDATAMLQLPMVAFVPSSIHNTCMQGTRRLF